MSELTFDVLVGNITEEYRNPILDYYWTDRIINGMERTVEYEEGPSVEVNLPIGISGAVSSATTRVPTIGALYTPTKLSTNNNARSFINHDMDYGEKRSHESGRPFIQTGGSGKSNLSNSVYVDNVDNINPTQPSTWIGNGIKFGRAFVENFVESKLDQAKMTSIPGLGLSFNQAVAAIQSKDLMTVFGMVRQAINQSIESSGPSSELSKAIVDKTFKEFVTGIAKSEATDGDALEFVKIANNILTDSTEWKKVELLSNTKGLISQGLEKILGYELKDSGGLRTAASKSTGGDRSIATDLDGGPKSFQGKIYEGVPSILSSATNRKIDSV